MSNGPFGRQVRKQVERLLRILARYKIVFDTIVVVLLSTMALVVTCQTNRVASYQAHLMETQHMPQFSLACSDTGQGRNGGNDTLIVANAGAPVTSLAWTIYSFIRVRGVRAFGAHRDYWIDVLSYYDSPHDRTSGTGRMVYAPGVHNAAWADSIRDAIVAVCYSRTFDQLHGSWGGRLVQYVELRYVDALGRSHGDMFEVTPVGYTPLSRSEANGVRRRWRVGQDSGLSVGRRWRLEVQREEVDAIVATLCKGW